MSDFRCNRGDTSLRSGWFVLTFQARGRRGWGGWGGRGGWGAGNFVHSNMMPLPKTSVCTAFSPLAKVPKTLVFAVLFLLYTTCYGTRHAVTSVHAFSEDAIGICSIFAVHIFATLYNISKHKSAVHSAFARKKRQKKKTALSNSHFASFESITVRSVFAHANTNPLVAVVTLNIVKIRPANASTKTLSSSRCPESNAKMTRAEPGRNA